MKGPWADNFRRIISKDGHRDADPSAVQAVARDLGPALRCDDEAQAAEAREALARKLVMLHVTALPRNNDKLAICVYCGSMRRANSCELMTHIAAQCVQWQPQKAQFAVEISSLKALNHLGKKRRAATQELADSVQQDKPQREPMSSGPGAGAGHSKRARCFVVKSEPVNRWTPNAQVDDRGGLPDAEVGEIDALLARWVYTEGHPLTTIRSEWLGEALVRLNPSYAERTNLNVWNLRHQLLDEELDRVRQEVEHRLDSAPLLCLVSDGWSDAQRGRTPNLMLATPTPYMLGHIATRSDAEYQAAIFEAEIRKRDGKVRAFCSDNASVMRKTWRLLRERLPGLWTFGSAAHSFALHARDICALDAFSSTVGECQQIALFFLKNTPAGGLATLRTKQTRAYGKQKAIRMEGKARWNAQLACAESLLDSKDALIMTASDEAFVAKDGSSDLRSTMMSVDFWARVDAFVEAMNPLRHAIMGLESDAATLADVYAHWIEIHGAHAMHATASAALLDVLQKRIDFLIHPLHFVSYAFHPLYCKVSSIARVVVRTWAVALGRDIGIEEEDLQRDMDWFFGKFMAEAAYKHVRSHGVPTP